MSYYDDCLPHEDRTVMVCCVEMKTLHVDMVLVIITHTDLELLV